MQVLTLDNRTFEEKCRHLADMVRNGTAARYDAIVAVRRGGSYVCDAFCRFFPSSGYGDRYDVSLQRPSTKRKNGMLSRILKRLPLPVLDMMRMAESSILSLLHRMKADKATPGVELPEGLRRLLEDTETPEILVVDDAIDSGDTLFAIAESLRNTNPRLRLRIAVITVTTNNPRIRPDFALFSNRTLIRFPWSNDFKNQKKAPHS